jgi:type IV pilus assembly protein PilE
VFPPVLHRVARRAARGCHPSRAQGVTLIELMVAVAIVGILAAIALPAYRRYVLQGNRTDAIKALAFDQQALERCYSQNFSYVGCAQTASLPAATADGYYTISFSVGPAATSYTLEATAAGTQVADTLCKTFQLTQAGVQTAQDSSDNDQTQTCWGGH